MVVTAQQLRQAQARLERTSQRERERRDQLIYQAIAEGWSQRAIARAMGLTHGRVAQIALVQNDRAQLREDVWQLAENAMIPNGEAGMADLGQSGVPTIEELKTLQDRLNLRDIHVVYIGTERYVIAHTDKERASIDLKQCELHGWLNDEPGPPKAVGYYVVTPHEVDAYSEPYPVARFDFMPLAEVLDAGGSQRTSGFSGVAEYPTHTGDSEADGLIAEFQSYRGSVPNSGYQYNVAKMGDPEYAGNMCKTVAQAFAKWMKRQEYQAKAEWGIAAEIYPKQSPKGLHMIVTLRTKTGDFIVDWAAAQYGVNEGRIPAVQPRGDIALGSLFDMEDRSGAGKR